MSKKVKISIPHSFKMRCASIFRRNGNTKENFRRLELLDDLHSGMESRPHKYSPQMRYSGSGQADAGWFQHDRFTDRFISDDPRENRDNEDARWQLFEILENDEERYSVVKDLWKNCSIPDPNENLTYYGYFARKMLRTEVMRKPPRALHRHTSSLDSNCSKVKDQGLPDGEKCSVNTPTCNQGECSSPMKEEGEIVEPDEAGTKRPGDPIPCPRTMTKFVGSGIYNLRIQTLEDEMQDEISQMTRSVEDKRKQLLLEFRRILVEADSEDRATQIIARLKRLQTFRDLSQSTIRQKYSLRQDKMKVSGEEVDTVMHFYTSLKDSQDGAVLNTDQVNDLLATEELYNKMAEVYGCQANASNKKTMPTFQTQ